MVVMQRPFRNRETNFCSIIYSVSSTDPENSAKIGPVDFEVCQESLKKETEAKHTARCACFQQPGAPNHCC